MLKEPLLFVNQTYCSSDIWTEYAHLSTDKMQASTINPHRLLVGLRNHSKAATSAYPFRFDPIPDFEVGHGAIRKVALLWFS
jgi:hypothetical protein